MRRKFFTARDGNVAMMFALLLAPMLIGAGIAIDMVRAGDARARLSEASDAGLLAASRALMSDATLTQAEAEVIARRYVDANVANNADLTIESFSFAHDDVSELFRINVVGSMKTTLLGVIGRKSLPIEVTAEAMASSPGVLELVLVLDNTDSMSGQKMTDLKAASLNLVEEVMEPVDNTAKVGIVPFGTHVRVGMSRAGAYWLSVPPDSSYQRDICTVDTAAASNEGCSEQTTTCDSDGMPYSCTQWVCPDGDPAPETCTMHTQHQEWLGCVGSRDHPLNIRDESFVSDRVPGVLNWSGTSGDCPEEIFPMSTDRASVITKINSLSTTGRTYIPGGLTWGLRLISSSEPFTEGASYADIAAVNGVKAIVLMTDGHNTNSPDPWSGAHYGDDAALANSYTLEVCTEIKSAGIHLYTIAFEVTDVDTQTMLTDCASSSATFYNATNAGELSDAFAAIGNNLTELALTR